MPSGTQSIFSPSAAALMPTARSANSQLAGEFCRPSFFCPGAERNKEDVKLSPEGRNAITLLRMIDQACLAQFLQPGLEKCRSYGFAAPLPLPEFALTALPE